MARRAHRNAVPAVVLAIDTVAITLTTLLTASSLPGVALFAISMVLARAALRAYRPRLHLAALDEVPRAVGAGILCLGVILGVRLSLFGGRGVATRSVVQDSVAVGAMIVLTAVGFGALRRLRRRRSSHLPKAIVIGWGKVARAIEQSLAEHPELGLRPVDMQGNDVVLSAAESDAVERRITPGNTGSLTRVIESSGADAVVLALDETAEDYADAVITVHQTGRTMFVVPSVFELHHDGPDVERVRGIPLIRLRPDPTRRPSWSVKRLFDVTSAAFGLLVTAPLLIAAAIAILIESGRPILFRQQRIGMDGKPFELLKLRSMRPATVHEGETTWNIADDPRLTSLGRLIRKSSIDEIPQLWNVLRGQMSLVGPRPERPVFVEKFSLEHERYWARHRVPAGLTGLAQVNGLRGDTSIRERARFDNYYIANWSLWLDAKIILLTAREVFGGRGG